jgi:hypothetical protein
MEEKNRKKKKKLKLKQELGNIKTELLKLK